MKYENDANAPLFIHTCLVRVLKVWYRHWEVLGVSVCCGWPLEKSSSAQKMHLKVGEGQVIAVALVVECDGPVKRFDIAPSSGRRVVVLAVPAIQLDTLRRRVHLVQLRLQRRDVKLWKRSQRGRWLRERLHPRKSVGRNHFGRVRERPGQRIVFGLLLLLLLLLHRTRRTIRRVMGTARSWCHTRVGSVATFEYINQITGLSKCGLMVFAFVLPLPSCTHLTDLFLRLTYIDCPLLSWLAGSLRELLIFLASAIWSLTVGCSPVA